MAGPVKRSLSVAGHATSVTLEPIFWEALARAAAEEGWSLAGLVARVDAARIAAPDPANLSSALRVWVVERLLADPGAGQATHLRGDDKPPDLAQGRGP